MIRFTAFLSLLFLILAPTTLVAADGKASGIDPSSFRWSARCTEIPSPRIAVCRVVPDVEQGINYNATFVPVTFQIDNQKGRSVTVGGDQNCLEHPAILRFGKNPPFEISTRSNLNGATFDRVIQEFRAAKTGTVEYAPLPDCKRVTATFYYSNLDEALAKALAYVNGDTN